ncbi:MAG: hypothetical protein WHV61_12390, partial [Burkholderiales bacterium]
IAWDNEHPYNSSSNINPSAKGGGLIQRVAGKVRILDNAYTKSCLRVCERFGVVSSSILLLWWI